MNKHYAFRSFCLLLGLLILSGCTRREINPAQLTPDDLFDRGVAAFQERRFDQSIRLLEYFAQQYLGDPRAPRARLLLGEAHVAKREFVTAITHYQRLLLDFPTTPLQLQARYSICDAYIRLSPRPQLDQEFTHSAIAHCESVATLFPQTAEGERAAEALAELRSKLAQKAYETGLFYFRRRAYDAAAVYFAEVVDRFPQTSVAPAALSQLMETYTRLGYVEEADEARQRLLREYPTSREAQALRA
jgi:outer membrane protein assembly factor BamD